LDKRIIIINPVAGRGRCEKIIPKIKEAVKKQAHSIDIFLTERKNHAKEFVNNLKDEYKTIYAVGGDGTINEVVNGIKHFENIILGILPFGSGNDFARSLGLKKANNNINSFSVNPIIKKIDLGEIIYKIDRSDKLHKTFFVNSLGIGFDALVSHLIAKNKTLKGLPLYLNAVFKAINKFHSFEMTANFDASNYSGKKLLIAIGNGKTSGGGFKLNPFAEINDGKLDVCLIDSLSKLKIIRKLPKAIFGTHTNLKEVAVQNFITSKIVLGQPSWMHSDGEVISDSVVEIFTTIFPGKLNVIMG